MAKARFSFSGDGQIRGNLRRFEKNMTRAMKRATKKAAREIFEDADENYVPEDSGDLRGTGRVEVSEKGLSATVVYGGGVAKDYAIAVHEHPSEASPPSWQTAEAEGRPVQFQPSGHGPEFLLKPWLKKADTWADELEAELSVERVGL